MAKHAIEIPAQAFPDEFSSTTSVFDVAEYLMACNEAEGLAPMSTMKLQKLVYFCQGWNMAATGQPMFPEKFEAWPSGPVCRELFELHEGEYTVGPGFFYDKLAALEAASATQPTAPAVP